MVSHRHNVQVLAPRTPRQVWVALGVFVGILALATCVLAVQGVLAKRALTAADADVKTVRKILAGDSSQTAARTVAHLRAQTDRARNLTDGPLWSVTSHFPWVGDDIDAIQIVAASIDRMADDAVPGLVRVGTSMNAKAFHPDHGRFNLQEFENVAPVIAASSAVLDVEGARIDAIDADHVIGPISTEVRELQAKVGSARSSVRAAALGTRMAPTLLGANKPRRYLLVFQNNAEIRSTGGLNGAFVVLNASDGKLTIEQPGSNADLRGGIEEPVLSLTEDETLVFPTSMGTDFRNTGFTPDFPRSAELERAIAKRKLGVTVSGVLSMDPVSLSYLLRGTGPVTLENGTVLTAQNAVRILLNEVYARLPDPRAQDAFFAAATKSVFETAMSGSGNPKEVMRALAQGVSERRVMFWSANRSEQNQIAGTALANELPGISSVPQYGVYLTDATQGKMQYYLNYATTVRMEKCSSDGVQTLTSTTKLTSTAPANAASLPAYITGGAATVPDGDQSLIVRLYGTSGGAFTSVTLDGKDQQVYALQHHGRPVTYALVKLRPGQSATVVATSVTGKGQSGDGIFLTTPGLRAIPNAVSVRSACN